MSGGRTVFVSIAVSMTVFLLAGGRFEKLVAKLGGPVSAAPGEKGDAAAKIGVTIGAWAVLLVTLSVMADFEATSKIAEAFALLIMLTVILAYGIDAFGAITNYVGGGTSSPKGGSNPGGPSPGPTVR